MLPETKQRLGRACMCAAPVGIGLFLAVIAVAALFGVTAGLVGEGVFVGGLFGTLYGHYRGDLETVRRIRSYLHLGADR